MSREALGTLLQEPFLASLAFITQPQALHHAFEKSVEVLEIRTALESGSLSEESIRKFASELVRQIEYGKRFPYELALAAIAVALETRSSDFSEEYIFDLAKLKLAEIPLAIRVAREASRRVMESARNKSKTFPVDRVDENQILHLSIEEYPVEISTSEKSFPFETV